MTTNFEQIKTHKNLPLSLLITILILVSVMNITLSSLKTPKTTGTKAATYCYYDSDCPVNQTCFKTCEGTCYSTTPSCVLEYQPCAASSDCCSGLWCSERMCVRLGEVVPTRSSCVGLYGSCSSSSNCCSGLWCSESMCVPSGTVVPTRSSGPTNAPRPTSAPTAVLNLTSTPTTLKPGCGGPCGPKKVCTRLQMCNIIYTQPPTYNCYWNSACQ